MRPLSCEHRYFYAGKGQKCEHLDRPASLEWCEDNENKPFDCPLNDMAKELDNILKSAAIQINKVPESYVRTMYFRSDGLGRTTANGRPIEKLSSMIASWWNCEKDKARYMNPEPAFEESIFQRRARERSEGKRE